MKTALVFGGLALAIGVPVFAIVQKERVLSTGTPMLVELAPVDPRSLIQGDYMRLDYAIARQFASQKEWPRDGHVVVILDSSGVAQFVRRHDSATPVAPNEHLLQYRRRKGAVRIGTDAFYFQEGHATRYEGARYGDLRVSRSGSTVLVGLRDSSRKSLGGLFDR